MARVEIMLHDEFSDTMREVAELLPLVDGLLPHVSSEPSEWFVMELEGLDMYLRPSAGALAVLEQLREIAGVG